MKKFLYLSLLFLSLSAFKAGPNDYKSIDAILRSLYDVISGPAGKRDWGRLRKLCVKNAQFNMVVKDQSGKAMYRHGTIDSYIQAVGPVFMRSPFYEIELGREVQRFGEIAHVFSAYETRLSPDGPAIERGINSIQLARTDGRWWIVNILWNAESDKYPLPKKFQP